MLFRYSSLFLFLLTVVSCTQKSQVPIADERSESNDKLLIEPLACHFISPINLPFDLAGSFAEPRTNHFHSGIDIKTNKVEGYPIFAVADGFISRIKISPFGYGKVVYVEHQNGYTSVYAHLQKFNKLLDSLALSYMYANQTNEIDIVLEKNKFKVKQADTIAFSGNSGGSTAPHLHFEIRETVSEMARNPLDFYSSDMFVDSTKPSIQKIIIKEFFNENFVLDTMNVYNASDFVKQNSSVVYVQQPYFTFAVQGYDKQNELSQNKNGIQKIEVFERNSLLFEYDIQKIDFNSTRACNVFFDYNYYLHNKNVYAYNCFQLTNNTLPIYTNQNKKIYTILPNDTMFLTIYAYDYNQNKTVHYINVCHRKNNYVKNEIAKIINKRLVSASQKDSVVVGNFKIIWNKNTFYDKQYLHYDVDTTKQKFIVQLYKDETPLHNSAEIVINNSTLKNKYKLCVVLENDNKKNYLSTTVHNDNFIAQNKELGKFYLDYDTIAPTISTVVFKNNQFSAFIEDKQSGILTYNLYVDDKWTPIYYDAKNNSIQSYTSIKGTKLKLVVIDKKNNISTYEK